MQIFFLIPFILQNQHLKIVWLTRLTCALNRHFIVTAKDQLKRKNLYICLMCTFLNSKIRGNKENKKVFFLGGL